MKRSTELLITFPVAMISIIFTVLNIVITIYLIAVEQRKHGESKNQENEKIGSFFKYTALITVIFNTLTCFFNTVFCVYLLLDPEFDDDDFYVRHPSHIYRILSTICWYIAQVSLIYVFTGRLYYTFHGCPFSINKNVIIYINIFNTIIVFSGLICGYYGVFEGNLILAEVGLNLISRVLYQIISFIVLYMFSKRLLKLTILNETMGNVMASNMKIENTSKTMESSNKVETKKPTLTDRPSLTRKPSLTKNPSLSITLVDQKNNQKQNVVSIQKSETTKNDDINKKFFLAVTTRNAILMLTVSWSVVMVTFCFFGFRFIFGTQCRLTLLIPMNMAAFDSINTSICILCLFRHGKKLYYKLCGQCDIQCKRMCLTIARKYV